MSKKSIFAPIIIVTTLAVLGVVGIATQRFHVETATNPNNADSFTNESPKKEITTSKIALEQASAIAQNKLSQLGIDAGKLKTTKMENDPVSLREYWNVRFEGAWVDIDPENGTVFGISVMNLSSSKFTIKHKVEAEKAARELYAKLQAPIEFKLTSVKMGNTGDYWSAVFEKEVLPGVYSKFESVNLLFSSDMGKLRSYRLFSSQAKSLEVKVTKEQAFNTARGVAESKGFTSFVDAKLDVEQANDYWNNLGYPKRADYCTLVWVVTFKDRSQHQAKIYVDSSTGSIVGGDQTR